MDKDFKIPDTVNMMELVDCYDKKSAKKNQMISYFLSCDNIEQTEENIQKMEEFIDLLVKEDIVSSNYNGINQEVFKSFYYKDCLEEFLCVFDEIGKKEGIVSAFRFLIKELHKLNNRTIGDYVMVEKKDSGKRYKLTFQIVLDSISKYIYDGHNMPQKIISLATKDTKTLTEDDRLAILKYFAKDIDFLVFCIKNIPDID